jgi:hypothetical protein
MVFSNGVLRSMSRSGGVEAHSHVGEGHVAVYGMVDWKYGPAVEKERMVRGLYARGSLAKDMIWVVGLVAGECGNYIEGSEWIPR